MSRPDHAHRPGASSRVMTRVRGTIIVAVMVMTALAAMVAAGLLFRMRAEVTASTAANSRQQAYEAASAGLQRTIAILAASRNDPAVWRDNPAIFQDQLAFRDGDQTWYFSVYAENPLDPLTPRYGVTDEASKININTAGAAALAKLPNMTAPLVDCLMDYRDRDSDTRPEGAEQEYYSRLPVGYMIKNGPLGTLEELLLVKGFTGAIVYGEDYNLNGVLDRNEDDGDDTFPPDNRDGKLDTSLVGSATVCSYEMNVDANGGKRINLNGTTEELGALASAGLPKETVDFVTTYRREGNMFRHSSQLLDMQYDVKTRKNPDGSAIRIKSGVDGGNIGLVMDKFTTMPANGIVPGLVNINTASPAVLACLEGMDEQLATQIADARGALDPQKKMSLGWLVGENVLDSSKFKQVAPFITGRSCQFRIRCVGYAIPSGRYHALEAIVDFAQGTPRVMYVRDISRMGMPVPVEVEKLTVK